MTVPILPLEAANSLETLINHHEAEMEVLDMETANPLKTPINHHGAEGKVLDMDERPMLGSRKHGQV